MTAHFNTNPTALHPLVEDHGTERTQAIQANLCLEDDVIQLFAKASGTFGPVQVVVINHGVWPTNHAPLQEMTLDQWKSTLDINLTSTFLVAREYLRGLESASEEWKAKAAIVMIGSTAGKYGIHIFSSSLYVIHSYPAIKARLDMLTTQRLRAVRFATVILFLLVNLRGASKAMMYGLTMSLKNEIVKIAPKGRVNTVAPGWVVTVRSKSILLFSSHNMQCLHSQWQQRP